MAVARGSFQFGTSELLGIAIITAKTKDKTRSTPPKKLTEIAS